MNTIHESISHSYFPLICNLSSFCEVVNRLKTNKEDRYTIVIHSSLLNIFIEIRLCSRLWDYYNEQKESFSFYTIEQMWAMAPHSSTLAWKFPWTEEPGRLQSMGSLRVGHDWVTSLSLSLSCIGEGDGNPLQCSCLKSPRDGGAWWAAVCGVTQSRTRLRWLSSSSILYYHFVNCYGLAFVGLFIFPPSLILFSYDLMTIFNATFGFLFLFCVCIYYRFLVCGYREVFV